MSPQAELLRTITEFLPLLAVLAGCGIGLGLAHRLLMAAPKMPPDARLGRQIIMLVLTGVAIVCVILAAARNDAQMRGQLLSLFGLVLTAAITLSSTSFVSNAMAGLMLRALRNFRLGDFLRVGDQFGRVTERGLFHTEIQTEDRDLATLPNLYLVTNPVRVVHGSGTVVSTTVSLGYDVPNSTVIPRLIEAAEAAGLEEPFAHVTGLGDHTVTYRVAGFLAEVKQLLSARSRLCVSVLDTLHGAGIEIASPTLMNQRRIAEAHRFLPTERPHRHQHEPEAQAEAILFDKADRAESLEQNRVQVAALAREIDELEKQIGKSDPPERELVARLEAIRAQSRELEQAIELEAVAEEERKS